MSSVIQLTWPEVARVKDALKVVEKIMTDCNFAHLELKCGLKVAMDSQGIRIEDGSKEYEVHTPDKPSSEGGD